MHVGRRKKSRTTPVKKLIILKAICGITGMTDKWFYQHIKDGRTWTGCESNPNWMGERGSDEYKENEKCFLIKLDGSTEYALGVLQAARGCFDAQRYTVFIYAVFVKRQNLLSYREIYTESKNDNGLSR